MRTNYNKLVRDRIPDIIRAEGRDCGVETLSPQDYLAALRAKIVEEAQELAQAPQAELISELADIQEVLDALMTAYGIERSEVDAVQARRRAERGGFAQRIRLLWTE
jgi:predicted house-cleaning noncanonical NTP pyrophosphatase (MazG superfamily)